MESSEAETDPDLDLGPDPLPIERLETIETKFDDLEGRVDQHEVDLHDLKVQIGRAIEESHGVLKRQELLTKRIVRATEASMRQQKAFNADARTIMKTINRTLQRKGIR